MCQPEPFQRIVRLVLLLGVAACAAPETTQQELEPLREPTPESPEVLAPMPEGTFYWGTGVSSGSGVQGRFQFSKRVFDPSEPAELEGRG